MISKWKFDICKKNWDLKSGFYASQVHFWLKMACLMVEEQLIFRFEKNFEPRQQYIHSSHKKIPIKCIFFFLTLSWTRKNYYGRKKYITILF